MSDFEIVWNSSFFGITVGEMALASLVLFAFILTRKFFARVVIERLKRWASLTKTDIDDQIVVVLQQPLMFLFFIIGLSIVVNWIAFSSNTEAILNQIIKSLIAFTIFWTGFRLVDPVSILFDKLLSRLAGPVAYEVKNYLLKFLKFFLFGSGVIAVLAQWGINPWPYFAGIGVLSLPFAFAAKDTVSNLFGGIKLILIDRAFSVGDWIEAPSIGHGTVEEITLSTVKIRKFSKAIQSIPNGILANASITNWSRMTNRRIKIDLGLDYSTRTDQFKAILIRIKKLIADDDRVDHTVSEMVHLVNFNSSSIDINLYYFTKTTDWVLWREIIEDHMLKFIGIIEEEGSSFAFPSRSIYIEGVNQEDLMQGIDLIKDRKK
ncbi:MAG: mechanosensitive ion channel family protein [Rhodospirillales bacterium]|nr:mechanosensitive ion channel family protein [Rhodospirillales bacterium]MDC0989389.1 mechanosensitive ion channel family protein [Rhodospirillales bacterium]